MLNNGALATITDSATGRTTTYYYDFSDRMMKYVESGSGYNHSVGYTYEDTNNNLKILAETINGVTRNTTYTYDSDNRVKIVSTDGVTTDYTYDAYGRIASKVTKNGSTEVLRESYTYHGATFSTTIASENVNMYAGWLWQRKICSVYLSTRGSYRGKSRVYGREKTRWTNFWS